MRRNARTLAVLMAVALSTPAHAVTAPNTAAFIGESVLDGSGVTTKPPTAVPVAAACWWPINTVYDYAVGGHNAADCLADWNNTIRGSAAGVLVLSCGMNSVRDGMGISAATIQAQLGEIATEASTDGLRVVWSNIIAGGSQPDCDATCVAKIAAVNSYIQTTCATLQNCRFVDAFTAFKGAGNGLSATCDLGDGQHLSETCTQQFVVMLANGLR